MSGYVPTFIGGPQVGLVQNRQNFLLSNDGFPQLINAYVWREQIKRKQGFETLGRLRRKFNTYAAGITSGIDPYVFNLFTAINFSGVITNGTATNPVVLTTGAPHGLTNNQIVTLSNITWNSFLNGGFPITVTGANSFSVPIDGLTFGAFIGAGNWETGNTANQIDKTIECGSVEITVLTVGTLIDDGEGNLNTNPGSSFTGNINYITGDVSITNAPPLAAGLTILVSFNYYPNLPVMGITTRETSLINKEDTVFFDTIYAYKYTTGFEEFLPGTTWSGPDFKFFWTTNYWIDQNNNKIFWETNDTADGIRYTNGISGTNWYQFAPTVDAGGTILNYCLCLLPFRGRLVAFNTVESGISRPNRIRWAEIGNPFTIISPIVSTVVADAWRDDIRGKGGFLDIPTNEDIITVGFVRDNLVIYCERSTWQLRYTGRSIAPFQIEKVNSELGVEATFSGVQFDTSIVGIGDKGVVECDSFKSERIDIKIPDLVQSQISNRNQGPLRVYGIRDIEKKLAYWIYPQDSFSTIAPTYPNRRLCYNYENDSWSIFTDSLTALGVFQNIQQPTWLSPEIANTIWSESNFPWNTLPSEYPAIMGGNQQGYIHYLNQQVSNDESLFIKNIIGKQATLQATRIESPNHNLSTGNIIEIIDIAGSGYATLNNQIFSVVIVDQNNFDLWTYNPITNDFDIPRQDLLQTYLGCGQILVRDNFSIVSKRFNYNDQGRQYQLGHIDLLVKSTAEGAFSFYVYTDYSSYLSYNAVNLLPLNVSEDTFFNSIIETKPEPLGINDGEKRWRRVFCTTNANFVTIEYTLSNSQMIGIEQQSEVQIDAQVIWSRVGGRLGLLT